MIYVGTITSWHSEYLANLVLSGKRDSLPSEGSWGSVLDAGTGVHSLEWYIIRSITHDTT